MRPAPATTLSTMPAPGRGAARKPVSWALLKAATGLLCGLATFQALAAPVVIDYTGAVIDRPGVIRSPGGFSVIVADNAGATALLRSRMGAILAHPETRAFQRQLIDATPAVAQAEGVVLRPGLADEVMAKLALMPPSFRASMAEDLERANRLELRWLSGRVHALGLAHIEPGQPEPPTQVATPAACEATCSHHRPVRLRWARLLRRVFKIDTAHCPNCGIELKIIAAILALPVIENTLTHLGLQARAPPRAPARRSQLQAA